MRLALAITAALLVQVAAGGAAGGASDGDGEDVVVTPDRGRLKAPTKPTPPRGRAGAGAAVTLCEACHAVEGWERVRFNHDPTGFPLRGAHVTVACGGCHAKGFEVPVTDSCSGCHRDRHAGEFGLHCEGCHDDRSWRPLFEADAHRRTNFPLVGKHALIPCQECHGNQRDRRFAGAAVACASCHEADFLKTGAISIDHTVAGFSRQCQSCHNTWRFWPARLASHDSCFPISSGAHHEIRCLGCHTSLGATTFTGACNTGTFTCSGCHAHACARSDRQHTQVMGYVCGDPKCYQCHNIGSP